MMAIKVFIAFSFGLLVGSLAFFACPVSQSSLATAGPSKPSAFEAPEPQNSNIRNVPASGNAHAQGDNRGGSCARSVKSEVTPPQFVPGINHTFWKDLLSSILLPQRKQAKWNNYYKDQCDWVQESLRNSLGINAETAPLNVVEIGTAWGGNAAFIANRFQGANVYAVDPLLPGYSSGDDMSSEMMKIARRYGNPRPSDGARNAIEPKMLSDAWAYALAFDGHAAFGCRYHLIKLSSNAAAAALARALGPQGLDFVFVDGLHTYEGVVDDINLYAPLMRPGGVMVFNDYGGTTFPGVTRAVDEFANARGLNLVIGDVGRGPGAMNIYPRLHNAGVVLPLTWGHSQQ
jgi:hypothetical protein